MQTENPKQRNLSAERTGHVQRTQVLGDELMTSFLPKAGAIWPNLRFRGNGHGSTLQEGDDQCLIYL